MPLIERYVLRRVMVAFVVTLGALAGTLWLLELLSDLDVVTSDGQAIWILIIMSGLGMPMLIQTVAPIAFTIATIYTLSNLNAESELAAISASGASRKAVYRPVLFLGTLVMIAVAFSHHVVSPASFSALSGIVTRVRADVIATLIQEGSFRQIEDELVLFIREKAADGSFRGIFVSDIRNTVEPVQYTAAEGLLVNRSGSSYFILQNGDMIRENLENGSSNVVRFETYALDLSQFTATDASTRFRPREETTLSLLSTDTPTAGQRRSVLAEIHNRLTSPLYTLIFALVALGFVGNPRTSRQDRGMAVLYASVICTALRTAGYTAAGAVATTESAIPWLYIIPAFGFALGLWLVLRHRPMRRIRALEDSVERIGHMASQVLRRFGRVERREN